MRARRDLEEMTVERGLCVDHTTIYRWVQHFGFATTHPSWKRSAGPGSNRRMTPGEWMRRTSPGGYPVKGQWRYLYRAVDSDGNTVEFMLQRLRMVLIVMHR